MQTRLYSDLFGLIQAMLGINFSVVEAIRVKALVNRRIQRAYRASNYWTRYLKVAEQRDVIDGIVPFTQSQMPTIDTFLRIYLQHPYRAGGGQEFEFTLTSGGAELIASSQASGVAFVTYKSVIADYYGDNAGEEPNIPYEWFQYVAHGVYADYLRVEGSQDRAAIAEQEASEILTDELMRLDEQHTQTIISPRIFTNSNMSTRNGYGSLIGRTIADSPNPKLVDEGEELIVTEDSETTITEG
jgi:hypothetical protein